MTHDWEAGEPEGEWGPVFARFGITEGDWKALAVMLLLRHHPALLNVEALNRSGFPGGHLV